MYVYTCMSPPKNRSPPPPPQYPTLLLLLCKVTKSVLTQEASSTTSLEQAHGADTIGEKEAGTQDLKPLSFKEIFKLNKPDVIVLLVAWVAATLTGCAYPIMSVLSGYFIRVRSLWTCIMGEGRGLNYYDLQVFGEPYDDTEIGRTGDELALLAIVLALYVGLAYFTQVC